MRRGFTNRRCPKCNGNIFIDQGGYTGSEEGCNEWYECCLQCGYTHYLEHVAVAVKKLGAIPAVKEPAVV